MNASVLHLILLSFDNSHSAHVDEGLSIQFPSSALRNTVIKTFIHLLTTLSIICMMISEVLYEYEYIPFRTSLLGHLACNGLIFCIFLLLECVKSRRYTGLPYLSGVKKERSKAIKKNILRFFFGKILESAICFFLILRSIGTAQDFEDWMNGDSIKGITLYIAIIVQHGVCEVFPIYCSLSSSYLEVIDNGGSRYSTVLIKDEKRVKNNAYFTTSGFSKSIDSRDKSENGERDDVTRQIQIGGNRKSQRSIIKAFESMKKVKLSNFEINFVVLWLISGIPDVEEEWNGSCLSWKIPVILCKQI